eukprot:352103-Chlamydomonas_euryale.AAC.8
MASIGARARSAEPRTATSQRCAVRDLRVWDHSHREGLRMLQEGLSELQEIVADAAAAACMSGGVVASVFEGVAKISLVQKEHDMQHAIAFEGCHSLRA